MRIVPLGRLASLTNQVKVLVGLKDAVFKPSSPLHHATELYSILLKTIGEKTILFIYFDGDPDY